MKDACGSSITRPKLRRYIVMSMLAVCLLGSTGQAETVYRDPSGEFSLTIPPGFAPVPKEDRDPMFVCAYLLPSEDGDVPIMLSVQPLGGTIGQEPMTSEEKQEFFRAFSDLGFEHRPLVILVICGSCMHFGRSFLG